MPRSEPTLHEVARAAGVSIATVSRVIHGGIGVSEKLRDRVQAAIDELGYRPSHLGRALVQRRHGAIGIVFPGLYGPYYTEVIHGIETVAIRNRVVVMILGTHLLEGTTDQVLALADRTDALAIFGGSVPHEVIEKLIARGKRLVLMAQQQEDDLPTVRADNIQSAMAVTDHLLDTHDLRRLVFLGNPDGSPDIAERWQGFVAAYEARGLTPPDEPIRAGLEVQFGREAGIDILSNPDRPEGIVCANDELAIGVLSAARALGVDIPGDVAVTGWDDIPHAIHAHPPLTTVHQPAHELGATAAQAMLAAIAGDPVEPVTVLDTWPIWRGSCGCDSSVDPHAMPTHAADRPVQRHG